MANYKGRTSVDPIERFNKKYLVDLNTGCWIWIGANSGKQKYGIFFNGQNNVKAHRFSYEYHIGLINDFCVLHKCDNPSCVNPDHLFLGTNYDNVLDKIKKNRQCKGESLGKSILTEKQVIEIKKELLNSYNGQITFLSKKYNISSPAISDIKSGRSWSHIQIP
jgi:hypothetical protein